MRKILFVTGLLACICCSNSDAATESEKDKKAESQISKKLVNPSATVEAQKVYGILYNLYGKKIVSGVVANIDWNYREAENVKKWTGKYPALNVFDFMNIHASKDVNPKGWLDYSDMTPVNEWWDAGGLVGCMWHWQVKANNGTDLTCTPGTQPHETSFDPSKIDDPSSAEYKLMVKEMDQVAGYLKTMQRRGIPVIWRPFHEASGNTYVYDGGSAWFWWGAKGAEVYKKLWRFMYDRFVNHHGLNNLIWVWNSQMGDKDWYPGDDVVDIVGRDSYYALQYPLMKEFQELQKEYPTKMITLAECGNGDEVKMSLMSKIWEQGSRWSWFMTWYDSDYNSGNSNEHRYANAAWWKDAFSTTFVVDRDEMKTLLGK